MQLGRVVCASCEREPAPDARAGSACAGCGARLVVVDNPQDLVGTVIDDRFEIRGKLGEGGMGTVYRAVQRSIGREVALKLVDRKATRDIGVVKRFLREAKLASQLAHPNTVGVIEFGQAPDGQLYLAMELVRGRTLHDVLRTGGPLPPARISHIGVQLVDALEAAHALSIVHRDLKLENIMLLDAPAGRDLIKILDFGLARSFAEPGERVTATGMIAGTPRALPPEVIEGAQPAPAQDLYALGIVLGELALGADLFEAPSIQALLIDKLRGLPPTVERIAPPALRELVAKLLAAEPASRPPHAEIRAALLALAAPAAPPPSVTPARALPEVEPFTPLSHPSASFRPPDDGSPDLEIDPQWQRERAERAAAAFPARPRPSVWWAIVTVVLLAALAAGGWYYATHHR